MRLTVLRLGHHGDGVADGPVYVPGALPGEVVEGEVTGGRMPAIVTPSPDRVKAPCPHYRACGGCSVMHASDAFVATWKADRVREALSAAGLDAALRPIATSPERTRRRAVFAGRRTRSGAVVGFHGRASGTITAIPDCRLIAPALAALRPALEELTVLGASRSGVLDLTATLTDSGADVAVKGGKPLDSTLFPALAAVAGRAGLVRLAWDGETVLSAGTPLVRMGGADVPLPPGAFLQPTRAGEAALQAAVAEALGGAGPVADLFAGCGTFALPLARDRAVHAVEGDAAMTAALAAGWRRASGLHRISTETRDLFRRPLLPDELDRFAGVVIDPPRAGAEAQMREIARSRVPLVAAVSCNPATFARDARILCDAGFRLDWVLPVDQFRWSGHVELAARLSRQPKLS